jgi:hypothetical protein
VDLLDLAEVRVRVAVAVGVLEDDELAELLRVAHLLDDAVVDRDDRSLKARVDVDASPLGVRGDHVGGVAGGSALGGGSGQRRGVVDVVGVAGVRGDREVGAFGEAGE